tara:strand:+ start:245 stop:652 length:408 start_codon:yes stop_codon:yes gene_type:complete
LTKPDSVVTKVKPKGRPKKKNIVAKTKGSRSKVGRPLGDASIINEYKARMLASPKSRKVLDSILSAALDDDHKNQAAAWKLCMDRLLPVSYFEKDKATGGKSAINISITGVGGETTIISGGHEDTIEGDYTDVEY